MEAPLQTAFIMDSLGNREQTSRLSFFLYLKRFLSTITFPLKPFIFWWNKLKWPQLCKGTIRRRKTEKYRRKVMTGKQILTQMLIKMQ